MFDNIEFGAETLPQGTHVCTLVAIDETEGRFGGSAALFTFEADSGDHAGKQIRRTTGLSPAADNACGQLISQLVGHSLKRGDRIDVRSLIGRHYTVRVSGSQITSVKPVAE